MVTLTRLGRKRRLVLRLEWLTLWPTSAFLPVRSHLRDMAKPSNLLQIRTPGAAGAKINLCWNAGRIEVRAIWRQAWPDRPLPGPPDHRNGAFRMALVRTQRTGSVLVPGKIRRSEKVCAGVARLLREVWTVIRFSLRSIGAAGCVAVLPLIDGAFRCRRRPGQGRRALHRIARRRPARQGCLGYRCHRHRLCRRRERHDDGTCEGLHRRTGLRRGARQHRVGQFLACELFGLDLDRQEDPKRSA